MSKVNNRLLFEAGMMALSVVFINGCMYQCMDEQHSRGLLYSALSLLLISCTSSPEQARAKYGKLLRRWIKERKITESKASRCNR